MKITNLEIMRLAIYPGWKESQNTAYLDLLVLIFKVLHKFEWIIQYIKSNS